MTIFQRYCLNFGLVDRFDALCLMSIAITCLVTTGSLSKYSKQYILANITHSKNHRPCNLPPTRLLQPPSLKLMKRLQPWNMVWSVYKIYVRNITAPRDLTINSKILKLRNSIAPLHACKISAKKILTTALVNYQLKNPEIKKFNCSFACMQNFSKKILTTALVIAKFK